MTLSLSVSLYEPPFHPAAQVAHAGNSGWRLGMSWEVAHLPENPSAFRCPICLEYVGIPFFNGHVFMGFQDIPTIFPTHKPILVGFQSGYLWIPLCSEDHPGCAVGYALLQLGWAIFIISRVADLSALVDQPHESVSNGIKNEHLGMRLPTYRKFLGRFFVFF